MRPQISRIRNQRLMPGAGDVDECAPASDQEVVHAVAPWLPLVDVPTYRAAAGNADDPASPDGLTLEQSATAIRKLYPSLAIEVHRKVATWTGPVGVIARVRGGRPASVSVLGSALPARLRFNFNGRHRVGLAADAGTLWIGQPLAPAESRWQRITEAELTAAIAAYPSDGLGGAIFMPTILEAFRTHPLYAGEIARATAPLVAKLAASKELAAKIVATVDG